MILNDQIKERGVLMPHSKEIVDEMMKKVKINECIYS